MERPFFSLGVVFEGDSVLFERGNGMFDLLLLTGSDDFESINLLASKVITYSNFCCKFDWSIVGDKLGWSKSQR